MKEKYTKMAVCVNGNHFSEQCCFVIVGKGLMTIGEFENVPAGDAVYIPSSRKHGIHNMYGRVLEYLTKKTV